VAGNGQSELAEILAGLKRPHRGTIRTPSSLGQIPEDRTRSGIIAEMSIAENMALRARRWRPGDATRRAAAALATFSIRARGPHQPAGELSGGNQQKVVLARELDPPPAALVAAEPTRGLDVEAAAFVQRRIRAAADAGAAILLITSDLDEAFLLADAVQVINRGKLSARMTPDDAAANLGALMAGLA
jgi:simple sugar transport system ATP-binding protein